MLKQVNLKDIARVISGYTFRKALEREKHGNISVIQAKDIASGTLIAGDLELPSVSLALKSTSVTVQDGDVLLVSRGTSTGGFKAAEIVTPEPNTIVASSVYILRPNLKAISSEYLSVFLNSKNGQETLRHISTGSNIRTLLMKELQEMRIPLPAPSTQKILASVFKNISHQSELLNKRKLLLQDILAGTIRSSIHA